MESNKQKQSKFKFTTEFLLQEGLVFITGAFLGAVITFILTWKSATDFWGAVGSMLAGLGTIGLLSFGWIKGNDWLTQMKSEKRTSFIIETSTNLIRASDSFHHYFKTEISPFLLEDEPKMKYLEPKTKYDKSNELKIHDLLNQVSIQLDTLIHLTSDNINLENETTEILKNYRQLHSKVFGNLQYKSRNEMRSLTLSLVLDSKKIQRSIINELLR